MAALPLALRPLGQPRLAELDNGAGGGGHGTNTLLRIIGTTCCENPVGKPRPPDPMLQVLVVTNRAAVVCVTFQLRGKLLGPVDFRPVGAGPGAPIGIVARAVSQRQGHGVP